MINNTVISCITIARQGFDEWASKPHNKRWFKKIDGTPIPNDLVVCIANSFQQNIADTKISDSTSQNEHEDFKAWAVENGMHDFSRMANGDYLRDPVQICWEAWQARSIYKTTPNTQAIEWLRERTRRSNEEASASIKRAGGQMTTYAERLTLEGEIAWRFADEIARLQDTTMVNESK